ncbi:hypothetical protein SAMN06298226_3096 [Nitrosovibrio sp. Nv4]|nr:hypothetical protein SAMN06298226_3096 [Nitrosovibrio sp. Nv4]
MQTHDRALHHALHRLPAGQHPGKGILRRHPGHRPHRGRTRLHRRSAAPLPTEVRIIRDTGAGDQAGNEANLEEITILHIPAKVYPNGSINFEYQFAEPGKFVGLVTVTDKEKYVSRFPFSVGEPKGTSPYLLVALAAIVVGALVFFLRGRKSEKVGAT